MIESREAAKRRWRDDPVTMLWDLWQIECDVWQARALRAYAAKTHSRLCMKACAGPGKSFVEAMAAIHHNVSYGNENYHPTGAALSCTGANLKSNLWREIAGWVGRSAFLSELYEVTGDAFFHKLYPKTWRIGARSFPRTANAEEQGRTLSGIHAPWVLILVDEAGDMAPSVGLTAEQAMSAPEVCRIIVSGNPTSKRGLLYAASVRWRKRWSVITITGDPEDPERSPRIPIEMAREQIATFGRDNAWVQAYILGEFPPGGINNLFDVTELEESIRRIPEYDPYAERRLGVDVAREGDDRTVIFPRHGLRTRKPIIMRNAKGHEIAARMALARERWKGTELELVDISGVGASVQDSLIQAGTPAHPVDFGGNADDPRYANKRAEMYFRAADWVKRGGAIPDVPELVTELSEITYSFTAAGKWILEPKQVIKKRLGYSPDIADAFACTFATVDGTRDPIEVQTQGLIRTKAVPQSDYDPLEDMGGGRCVVDVRE